MTIIIGHFHMFHETFIKMISRNVEKNIKMDPDDVEPKETIMT